MTTDAKGLSQLNESLNKFFFKQSGKKQKNKTQQYLDRKKEKLRKRAFGK